MSTRRKVGSTAGQNHDGTTLGTELALQFDTGTTLTASSNSYTFSSSTGQLAISNTTAFTEISISGLLFISNMDCGTP